jgi:endonuclease/exonuclease/phosphatase family metal-dependent hydrolase
VAIGLLGLGLSLGRGPAANGRGEGYLFCFWNVENLFDDQHDHRESRADQEFDAWFASRPEDLRLKLSHLSEALVRLNRGRGPDILAVAEVESVRAAELLRDALNNRLKDPSLHYTHVIMKNVAGGRHIGTAILTRLPVQEARTHLHGSRQRILEGRVQVRGHELVIVASHWTSRVNDDQGHGRDKYGDVIYGIYKNMYRNNPKVDFLVCGDFNDPPEAESVTTHLHATRDNRAVQFPSNQPLLLDLFADKDPKAGWGTHFFNGRWYIFDHIVISAGLLDRQGWSCDPKSVQTINSLHREADRQRRPWRFGNEHDMRPRGYSDHFPVTVRLFVN